MLRFSVGKTEFYLPRASSVTKKRAKVLLFFELTKNFCIFFAKNVKINRFWPQNKKF